MSGFTRERNTSSLQDFSQAKRPTDSSPWFCCKCVAAQSKDLHGNCLLCGHLSCKICKTIHSLVSANYEQAPGNTASRTQEDRITGDASYYPGPSQGSRQNLMEEKTLQLEGIQSAQSEQSERLEQGCTKRQKLSRFKCERCRHDKKKVCCLIRR